MARIDEQCWRLKIPLFNFHFKQLSLWLCFLTFVAECVWSWFCAFLVPFVVFATVINCLSTAREGGTGTYCKLNSPKRVPAVYWFCGTLLHPNDWSGKHHQQDLPGTCMSSEPVTTQFFLGTNTAALTGRSQTLHGGIKFADKWWDLTSKDLTSCWLS